MQAEIRRRPPYVFAAILVVIAAAYLYGGIKLIAVGGSFYYALAGATIAWCAQLLFKRNRLASRVYGGFLVATLLWAFWEVGANAWALMPRVLFPFVVGLWFLTPWLRRSLYSQVTPPPLFGNPRLVGTVAVVAVAIIAGLAWSARTPVRAMPQRAVATTPAPADASIPDGEWPQYGRTTHATRYARLDQITPQNVGKLEKLWHKRTNRPNVFKATPIQVGDLLYICTAFNFVQALDAESGDLVWEFDSKSTASDRGFTYNCRGVSYFKTPPEHTGDCPERIIMGTTDARVFALDAKTGARCQSFGNDGEISLLPGMGEVKPGFYYVTSPLTIARGLAIVGGWVMDNVEVNEPSGVIRAFDATTGKFVWAWDMGRPGVNTEPPEGEWYTRGTPNMWSMSSYDDNLGLVYVPLGNATPDYFGAHRTPEMEKYTSALVALDVTNGDVRWSFQTVHHDIWDYDVPSQPALVDLPQNDGSVIPAVAQATKRGEIFLLDRRDGKPIADVEERPVPQGAVPEDFTAPTQPFSVGMPHFRDDWSEATMWGITPFDQMWCRIEFKKLRYEGHFTPPSTQGTLQFPGNAGGFNWGSVAIDEDRQLLVAHPLIMGNRLQLHPRAEIKEGMRVSSQTGTPYGMTTVPFLSPLNVPCNQPPYGRLAVIDLQTRELLWNRSIGTTNEIGPWGTRFRIPLPMGVPLQAGAVVTKGGLIFIGGTMDRYFRAFDVTTGEELWRDYLPASAQASPMTYVSPKTKRQIVVITVPNEQRAFGRRAAGTPTGPTDSAGGHIIAYALPSE
ncbi:MAG TPA: membrane-bound PQQ-dependent dehydrogenase, glucose/quinate/shikimate family [Povalibacter sp.]|uniref:membrane-bound PQQ-dependent dehydrogenase, glucose/quinate/shikimate family n=1 Tax=Povalibacter sp. TaxID=1962978 RepID=UPI002BBE3AFC|nr:membrane-bound PQQ-dependent dehydrogenase, glucose/quinate/shikimate family [Povalibacter sp.]HMN47169.1 membrane-bound PQQ-dependent dehydrogenase, glucose/quinate/shikimate family [Povalibacter sp.]